MLTLGNITEVQEDVLQKGDDIRFLQGKLQLVVLHLSELRELVFHLHLVAQIVDTAEVDIYIIDGKRHECYIYKVCPPGGIERRAHLYLERHLFRRPHTVGIARTHVQGIMPHWQIAILRKVDAREIAPTLVIPLEIIGE